MLNNIYNFKRKLEDDGIIFTFCGPMSHSVVEGVGSALRLKMNIDEDITTSTSLKVFSIFVEQMQNVINYSSDRIPENNINSEMSFGIIVVGKRDNRYFIIGGNKIENSKKEILAKNLMELKKMNKDELKKLYKEKRKIGPTNEDSKGAGLGFIEMARKATEPIEFIFEDIDENYSFFSIETIV